MITGVTDFSDKPQSQERSARTEKKENDADHLNENYLLIYYRRILGIYLQQGYLPSGYEQLTTVDLKQIVSALCNKRDDLLAKILLTTSADGMVRKRLYKLIDADTRDEIRSYLDHFVEEKSEIFRHIIDELYSRSEAKSLSFLSDKTVQLKLFIEAITESSFSENPEVFKVKTITVLYSRITNEDLKLFLESLLDKRFGESLLDHLSELKKEGDFTEFFTRQIRSLIDSLKHTGMNSPDSFSLQKTIEETALLGIAAPTFFIESMLRFPDQVLLLYDAFKTNLTESLWIKTEKIIWTDARLKDFVQKYIDKKDIAGSQTEITILSELDASNLHELKETDFEYFIVQLRKNKNFAEKLAQSELGIQVIKQIKFSQTKTNNLLEALYQFEPNFSETRISRLWWKSVILRFASFAGENKYRFTSSPINKSFSHFLFSELKTLKKENHFFTIAEQLSAPESGFFRRIEMNLNSKEQTENQDKTKDEVSETNRKHSKGTSFYLSILLFYAQTGYLPWWSEVESESELLFELNDVQPEAETVFAERVLLLNTDEQLFPLLLKNTPAGFIRNFETIVNQNSVLKESWKLSKKTYNEEKEIPETKSALNIIPEKEKNDLKELLSAAVFDNKHLSEILYKWNDSAILAHWPDQRQEVKTLLQEYLSLTPYFYFRETTPASWREEVYKFSLRYFTPHPPASVSLFHSRFLSFLEETIKVVSWRNILQKVHAVIQKFAPTGNIVFPSALLGLLPQKTSQNAHTQKTIIPYKMETNDSVSEITTVVYNAGLVLVWPFLARLFESLKYTGQGMFVNDEYRNRAVYLLQFLVYNQTEYPEYEMVLNKLLTGIPAEIHLTPVEELSEEEKTMTQSLLHGMIHNWEKVRNSSPEGLQETFLQREGILTFKEEFYHLQVEKKGVDVLMQTIPWKFNTIKLMWMEKPIHVDWI